jgi:hypothetical protein
MVILEGVGTISVTEPGRSSGTYYEDAKIQVFDNTVLFVAYNKNKSAALSSCLISWDGPPKVRITEEK